MPEGLLDVYIAMIPMVDGDATPLWQRPFSVLPVTHRLWASAWLSHLKEGLSPAFVSLYAGLVTGGLLLKPALLLHWISTILSLDRIGDTWSVKLNVPDMGKYLQCHLEMVGCHSSFS